MLGWLSCPSEHRLRQFALGLLAEAEGEWIGQHLGRCSDCLESLSRLQVGDEVLEALSGVRSAPLVPSRDVIDDLRRQLGALSAPGPDGTNGDGPDPVTPAPPGLGEPANGADLNDLLGAPEGPDEIGRLGPYAVVELLGAGGMGAVFRARQQWPRRVVALKVLRAGSWASRDRRVRFRAEAEAVARLQHPGIIQVYEVGEREGLPYFTMEYLDGGSLAGKLAQAPLTPRAAAELVEALARAVQHAHEQGIIHRDLKPSNVLLTASGAVKISDFGLARHLDEGLAGPAAGRTETGAILGTPAYMAPEQAEGHSKAVGPAADIYAVGAILYECLTGRPPFRAATVLETLDQVRSRDPVPPNRLQPGVPRDLQTICLKCLEKEPAKRYATAADLADDLRRFLDGSPIQARPVSWRERGWKWVRRQPILAALLAACALMLIALLVGGLVYQARLREAVARAEAEQAEARRQQVQAATRYRAAHDALEAMLQRERGLGGQANLDRLQKLLEDQLLFYQALQKTGAVDPVVRRDIGWAFAQAGQIQFDLGQKQDAARNLRQGIALLEALPPESCSSPLWQERLAECYIYLGMVAGEAGRRDECERACRQTLTIRERLARDYPDEPRWQDCLADAELRLATLYRASGRMAEAETHCARSLALTNRLVQEHPGESAYRGGLPRVLTELGWIYQHTHRPGQAEAAYAQAEKHATALLEAHPEDLLAALTLANVSIVWGTFLLEQGQREAARQRTARGVALAEAILRREPRRTITRAYVRNGHWHHARACAALGRWAETLPDWDRVVELDAPANEWARRQRVLALARAGQHARVAAEVEVLTKMPGDNGYCLWQLAVIYAGWIETVRSDAHLSPIRRHIEAGLHGDRALALLRKLLDQGYFYDKAHAWALWTDKGLKPLHDHSAYRNLLAEWNRRSLERARKTQKR